MSMLRFDPDPFFFNVPLEKPRRVHRKITDLSLDTQPQGPVLAPKAKAQRTQVTEYDSHGRPPDRRAQAPESFGLPPSLVWLVDVASKFLAVCVWSFWVLVIASRRQRRNVLELARTGGGQMKTATLKLETLHLIPGLREDFEQQIESLVADCKKRPGITKKRSVKVEFIITPHKEDPEDVLIWPVVGSKRPSTDLDPIRARRTRAGQLQFDFAEPGELEE